MKLSKVAINQLQTIVSGDELTQYKSGRDLVDFFNLFGERDDYDSAFTINNNTNLKPSRKDFVVAKLIKLNDSKKIKDIIEKIINEHQNDKIALANKITYIIKPENYRLEEIDGAYRVISQDNYDEDIKTEVHFENIQKQILEEISKAKFLIWVAVAWFTDEVLFNKLVEKKEQGINVQVIIIDDYININLDFQKYFETYRIPKSPKFQNLMHHKFCVIDLSTVIQGSYNWTKKAQFNQENITIDKNRKSAEDFANKFIMLKKPNNM